MSHAANAQIARRLCDAALQARIPGVRQGASDFFLHRILQHPYRNRRLAELLLATLEGAAPPLEDDVIEEHQWLEEQNCILQDGSLDLDAVRSLASATVQERHPELQEIVGLKHQILHCERQLAELDGEEHLQWQADMQHRWCATGPELAARADVADSEGCHPGWMQDGCGGLGLPSWNLNSAAQEDTAMAGETPPRSLKWGERVPGRSPSCSSTERAAMELEATKAEALALFAEVDTVLGQLRNTVTSMEGLVLSKDEQSLVIFSDLTELLGLQEGCADVSTSRTLTASEWGAQGPAVSAEHPHPSPSPKDELGDVELGDCIQRILCLRGKAPGEHWRHFKAKLRVAELEAAISALRDLGLDGAKDDAEGDNTSSSTSCVRLAADASTNTSGITTSIISTCSTYSTAGPISSTAVLSRSNGINHNNTSRNGCEGSVVNKQPCGAMDFYLGQILNLKSSGGASDPELEQALQNVATTQATIQRLCEDIGRLEGLPEAEVVYDMAAKKILHGVQVLEEALSAQYRILSRNVLLHVAASWELRLLQETCVLLKELHLDVQGHWQQTHARTETCQALSSSIPGTSLTPSGAQITRTASLSASASSHGDSTALSHSGYPHRITRTSTTLGHHWSSADPESSLASDMAAAAGLVESLGSTLAAIAQLEQDMGEQHRTVADTLLPTALQTAQNAQSLLQQTGLEEGNICSPYPEVGPSMEMLGRNLTSLQKEEAALRHLWSTLQEGNNARAIDAAAHRRSMLGFFLGKRTSS